MPIGQRILPIAWERWSRRGPERFRPGRYKSCRLSQPTSYLGPLENPYLLRPGCVNECSIYETLMFGGRESDLLKVSTPTKLLPSDETFWQNRWTRFLAKEFLP